MIYEIWDEGSRNLVGSFTTEDEALDRVRTAVDRRGRRVARLWALMAKDVEHDGHTTTLAHGAQLIERAARPMPA